MQRGAPARLRQTGRDVATCVQSYYGGRGAVPHPAAYSTYHWVQSLIAPRQVRPLTLLPATTHAHLPVARRSPQHFQTTLNGLPCTPRPPCHLPTRFPTGLIGEGEKHAAATCNLPSQCIRRCKWTAPLGPLATVDPRWHRGSYQFTLGTVRARCPRTVMRRYRRAQMAWTLYSTRPIHLMSRKEKMQSLLCWPTWPSTH